MHCHLRPPVPPVVLGFITSSPKAHNAPTNFNKIDSTNFTGLFFAGKGVTSQPFVLKVEPTEMYQIVFCVPTDRHRWEMHRPSFIVGSHNVLTAPMPLLIVDYISETLRDKRCNAKRILFVTCQSVSLPIIFSDLQRLLQLLQNLFAADVKTAKRIEMILEWRRTP